MFCEDCDEEYLDERVNLQQGFQPHAPVFLMEHESDDSNTDDDFSEISHTDLLWSENEHSEACSEWSENAIEVTDVNNVEWIQQPDGSYSPWEWFPTESGEYECFLVYLPEPDETDVIEQMADLYVAANREHLTDVSEEHMKELKKIYVADVQAKRNFGKEKGQGKKR